jgi:prepilin-type N-terminal cleavage/methylation domain-containing protein
MVMRRAFTLVELLVVIAIIGLLIGLLVPLGLKALLMARGTKTAVRIQALQRALSENPDLADGQRTMAADLHARLAALAPTGTIPGVTRFAIDQRLGTQFPKQGTWIPTPYPAWCFPHPWGKLPTDLSENPPSRLPDPTEVVPMEEHGLRDLNPDFSAECFVLAGLLDATAIADYRTDRDPDRPWNDAWGYPIVVGLGLYQPRANTAISAGVATFRGSGQTRTFQDLFIRRAVDRYGYARSLYISAGAVGPKLPDTVSEADLGDASATWTGGGLLAALWTAINDTCNAADGTEVWRTTASGPNPFIDPPWKGVRTASGPGGVYRLLAAPLEVQ